MITAQAPALRGDIIALFATGLGATEERGGLEWAQLQPEVEIGGVRVAAAYAGRAPGFAGLDQINFVVSASLAPGAARVRLMSNGRVSNETTLAIN